MKMKSQRKIQRDRTKRESARNRAIGRTEVAESDDIEVEDADIIDEIDLQTSRALAGYDD